MARTRTHNAPALTFEALTVEGALISPAMLTRIAAHQAGGQTEADYGVPKGLTLRDEIARYFRIGQALFGALTAGDTPSLGATIKFVENLLHDVFGFADLKQVRVRTIGGRQFAVTLEGLGGCVPIVIVPPADEIDRPSDHLPTDGRRLSAASAIQDWLNATDQSLWGFCSNGFRLRLVRDNASLTRPAYIEADLRAIFQEENFADFTALWLLVHASRFGQSGALLSDCVLERWRDAGQKEGVAARDRLRDGVEAALLNFGNGFLAHPDNDALRERLRSGDLPLTELFGQLLRLVYRLIFLLAAEDRDLLHPPGVNAAARKLYAEGYSVAALRESAVRRAAWDRHYDRWDGLLITFAALARGEKVLGLPALDGLFAAGTLPDLENAKLANRSLMEAIFRLAWLKDDSGLASVNWRDMETEELGSVYESLLELTPQLNGDGRYFKFAEGAEAKGHARKTTGSYYTPDSLVQALLDSALDPVLDRVEAEGEDPAAALLSVTVLDPACGSGHFLLAAARRIATRLASARTHGLASPADFRHAIRDVARACIHGVDRNPMAVELTKVALWIETVEPGKPLGFLDANIRCGDALLGAFDLAALEKGVPDAAYKPLTGDDKETAKHFEKRNKAERDGQGTLDFAAGSGRLPAATPIAGEARALRAMPEDSAEEIALKRKRFEAAHGDMRRWNLRRAADLYIAAFLTPKTGGVPANRNTAMIPTTAHIWDALAGRTIYGPLVGRAQDLASASRAFHWPLEFPDIMAAGGFDVVLGNPPWDIMELDEGEYFAQRRPEIAVLGGAARKDAIAALERVSSEIFASYQADKRRFESGNEFARTSGRFELTARGRLNTYALFAELFARAFSKRGRAGAIVPTGIATDGNTAAFFSSLIANQQLVSLYDFQTGMGFFDRIGHARFKFALITMAQPGFGERAPEFSFFSRTISDFRDRRRFFRLTEEDICRINPNTRTAPVFRTELDAAVCAKICARTPILISELPNERKSDWGIEFRQGLFNKTADGKLFRTHSGLADCDDSDSWLPVYEGNHGFIFDHRSASYNGADFEAVSLAQKGDPEFEVRSEIFIKQRDFQDRIARKGFRDTGYWVAIRRVARSTDERTVVAAIIPSLPATYGWLIAKQPLKEDTALICANLNALVFDYCMRLKLSQPSIPLETLYQMPFLCRSDYASADRGFIVPRVLELTYTSGSMAPFARDLGFNGPPFAWDEERRDQLRAELDAWYARAYGLTRDELRYILDPADVKGPDYPSETFRVLKKNEIAEYGEYRTARLVLAAWDREEEALHNSSGLKRKV